MGYALLHRKFAFGLFVIVFMSFMAPRSFAALWKTSPSFAEKFNSIKRIALFLPMVRFYEGRESNRLVLMDEWSNEAVVSITEAIIDEADRAGIGVATVGKNGPGVPEATDLYFLVDYSVCRHAVANAPEPFPDRAAALDYSIGDISAILDRVDADAALFLSGADVIVTPQAKADDAAQHLLGAVASAGTLAIGRGPIFYGPVRGPTFVLRAALFARDGSMLLHSALDDPDEGILLDGQKLESYPPRDLRDKSFARLMAATFFERYRRAGQ